MELLSVDLNSTSRVLHIRGKIINTSNLNFLLYSIREFSKPFGKCDTCCLSNRISTGLRIVFYQKNKLIFENSMLGEFYPKVKKTFRDFFCTKRKYSSCRKKQASTLLSNIVYMIMNYPKENLIYN